MIDLGDVVPLSFQIKDASGALANATTVTLTVAQPDGTVAGPFTLTPTSTGVYNYDFTPTQAGRHVTMCVSTGSNASSYADTFDVAEPSRSIISLADAKAQLRVTQSSNDDELRMFLEAATALVEHEVGPVVPATHVEIVNADDTIVLTRAPVMSVTSIVAAFPGYTTGPFAIPSYQLDGPSGLLRQQPFMFAPWGFDYGVPGSYAGAWTPYGLRLSVTYVAGRPVVPAPLQVAARIIVAHLWETRRGAGPKPAGGDDEMAYGREMVPDEAIELMAPYRRAPLVV